MPIRRTTLYQSHVDAGARMTEFAGYEMPVAYPPGTRAEHTHTRNATSLFDTSHMGQFRLSGPDAADWLAAQVTADVSALAVGRSTYALVCRKDGGVIDDIFVYRGDDHLLLVVNAARREGDWDHLVASLPASGVTLTDISDDTAMIAVQGPTAHIVIRELLGEAAVNLPRFGYAWQQTLRGADEPGLNATHVAVGRTGYTGEDGFELYAPAEVAPSLWSALIRAGERHGVVVEPAGLAARDSLRLEAGFALYGHELHEEVSPAEARLLWACDLEHAFRGRDAIVERRDSATGLRLIRLVMSERGVPREGYTVVSASGEAVGSVASGGYAPTLDAFIANAWVAAANAKDDAFGVTIRDKVVPAARLKRPAYRARYTCMPSPAAILEPASAFVGRHIGATSDDTATMLKTVGADSLEELIDQTIPATIRRREPLRLPPALSEHQALARLSELGSQNTVLRSLIGLGYHASLTPPVVQRNILENPRWYTQYTPYQAEIAQGRLEALLNFQTMITGLTGMEIANASMLDSATSAAEAMALAIRATGDQATHVVVDPSVDEPIVTHLSTRAEPLGVTLVTEEPQTDTASDKVAAWIVQYPATDGTIPDLAAIVERAHKADALAIVVTDPLALTLLTPPGEVGADVVVGSTQRFGLPMWNGGPHAAFFATRERFKRMMPGRLVGVSRDRSGRPALRLALQTREQHIRRDRATSNICTAQVLLAIAASMYAVYHGPDGLAAIARRIRLLAHVLRAQLRAAGFTVNDGDIFDTVRVTATPGQASTIHAAARKQGFNLRVDASSLTISLDERSTAAELAKLLGVFGVRTSSDEIVRAAGAQPSRPQGAHERTSPFMTESVFHDHRSETQLLRYITTLQSRDLSLANSMIPLGSCTMKLNPTAAMVAVTWPQFADIHPFAPQQQMQGYAALAGELERWLCEITDFAGCTLQPNSGAQGEYTGLLMIRSFHRAHGDHQRTVCLVPESAHGTNPASAVMAGMDVVVIPSSVDGAVDIAALEGAAAAAGDRLAAMMVTYPSTHGVFEPDIRQATEIVHRYGGQVYMDGANMNAQVGLTSPGLIGADVCHLNLHKTFAIPHGGGGPGVGPVLCAAHLVPFLPGTPMAPGTTGVVAHAPMGSAGIFSISWAYIAMLGGEGLTQASRYAILNANYIARRLGDRIPIAFTNAHGRVAHECIFEFRETEKRTGVTVEDIAKRLADYGFHAPTMSWPVKSSLMVEPTESENLAEIDRFCDAMLAIMDEIDAIGRGEIALEESPLRLAPHTVADVSGPWERAYSREQGGWPAPWSHERTFWPAVGRVDNPFGDRNLVCTCAPLEEYARATRPAAAGG